MLKIIAQTGHEEHAIVYIMEDTRHRKLECVESVQPPIPRSEKWVLLVSTLFGCPVGCPMCDAGGSFHGYPTAETIIQQIDSMVRRRFPSRQIPSRQFKIQFARMGDPCLNPAVLDVLDKLPELYQAPGLMPSVSTIAPAGCEPFIETLSDLKNRWYPNGRFQLQFSIHSTDPMVRQRLIPVKTLTFQQMADLGNRFFKAGDRKITLNFALGKNQPVDPEILEQFFSPDRFLIKITPLNPTYQAQQNGLTTAIDPVNFSDINPLIKKLEDKGYQVILSIGNTEENRIGSNCGQFLQSHLRNESKLKEGYQYPVTTAESC